MNWLVSIYEKTCCILQRRIESFWKLGLDCEEAQFTHEKANNNVKYFKKCEIQTQTRPESSHQNKTRSGEGGTECPLHLWIFASF